MTTRTGILIALTGLTLTACGCDRGWMEFQKIELGQPLPKESLLLARHSKTNADPDATDTKAPKSLAWWDHGVWPVPLSYGMHAVSVQVNDKGLVSTKTYYAMVSSNYALFTAIAMREVWELRPPADLLLNPTEKVESEETLADLDKNPTLHSYIDGIEQGPTSNAGPAYPEAPPHCLILASGINYVTGMSFGGRYHDLEQSLKRLPLKGIELEGYDRTFRPVLGGSIRLQNLGQGRIRIETKLFHLYDPLALSAQLYFHLSQE